MSLSTLGAQLASLHSKSTKNPGSLATTSRRTIDAIGRGLTHSAIHGHSVRASDKFIQPSILYDDARTAADVPLATLRENAASSLGFLAEKIDDDFHKYTHLVKMSSLQSERGLLTVEENKKLNKSLRQLLMLIGSVLGESSSRSPTSYYANCLHILEYLLRRHDIHLQNSQDLVVSLLPHHDTPIFGRVLQLVNLAELDTFVFLRPYATPGSHLPNRTVLAKQAAKDKALVKIFCELAHFLHQKTPQQNGARRRGCSQVTSFACSVLVQALNIQCRTSGTCDEATVRLIMPYILQGCSSNRRGGEYQAFSYIIASALSEYVEFSVEIAEKLTNSIWQGSADISEKLLLIINFSPKKKSSTMLNPNKTPLRTILLPDGFCEKLQKYNSLPQILGALNKDANISILIISLIDWILKFMSVSNSRIILNLLREPSLASFWKESKNKSILALTATIIHLVAKKKQKNQKIENLAKEMIDELRLLSSNAVNQAVAQVVIEYRKSDMKTKKKLANVLNIPLPSSSSKSHKEDATLLPPRVALEHYSASIRRNAMKDLVPDKESDAKNTNFEESLPSALLRHVATEEDAGMIIAAAEALDRLFKVKPQLVLTPQFCNELAKLMFGDESPKLDVIDAEIICVNLLGDILRNSKDNPASLDSHRRLMALLVANLSDLDKKNEKLVAASAKSLYIAVANDNNKMGKDYRSDVKELEAKVDVFLVSERTIIDAVMKSTASKTTRRNALLSIMQAVKRSKDHGKRAIVYETIFSLIKNLSDSSSFVSSLKNKKIMDTILYCARVACTEATNKEIVDLIIIAASIPSEETYRMLSVPVLDVIGTFLMSKVSPGVLFLEVALKSSSIHPSTVARLIDLSCSSLLKEKEEKKVKEIIILMIALLGHSDSSVRQAALDLFAKLQPSKQNPMTSLFKSLSGKKEDQVTSFVSTILMDGAAALPALLRECTEKSSDPKQFCRTLLLYCVEITTAKWIPCPIGCQRAIAVLMSSTELAGEKHFPLVERWTIAGQKILEQLLRKSQLNNNTNVYADEALVSALVRIFKGALVHDSTEFLNIIISSGSNQRGMRSRSYSVGRSSGISYADPYPSGMVNAIDRCLSIKPDRMDLKINHIVVQEVLASESWCKAIFKELPSHERIQITNGLINVLKNNDTKDANEVFLGLPLPGKDICRLITDHMDNLSEIATLMDYIRSNSSSLANEGSLSMIISSIFSLLSEISSPDRINTEDGGIEFVRNSALQGLINCFMSNPKNNRKVDNKKLNKYTELLVALIGGGKCDKKTISALSSWKARKTALSVICALCSQNPKYVVKQMLSAFLKCMEPSRINNKKSSNISSVCEVITTIVPVFSRFCAAANLSMLDLFKPFLERADQVEDEFLVSRLFSSMAQALSFDGSMLSDFFCLHIAKVSTAERSALSKVVSLLVQLEPGIQIKCVRKLCAYVHLHVTIDKPICDNQYLSAIIESLEMKLIPTTTEFTLRLCRDICTLISQTLSNENVKEYIESSDVSSLCLELWQDLMVLQSSALQVEEVIQDSSDIEAGNQKTFVACKKMIDESLTKVQCLLPIPVFLASVTNLIEDDETTDLCAKALRMISERTPEVDPNSPEASLFLELLPMITNRIRDAKNNDRGMMVQQAATVVIEGFIRSFCLSSYYTSKADEDVIFQAFEVCTNKLSWLSSQKVLLESMPSQLACSFALCISTLLRFLKARALPLLPKNFDAVIAFLLTIASNSSQIKSDVKALVQTSMTRTMASIIRHLPQFLLPHLEKILSPAIIPSFNNSETDLGAVLAQHVPVRQLLPAIVLALEKCSGLKEYEILLSMTTALVKRSQRKEANAMKLHVLNIILLSCDFSTSLINSICKTLLAMVMKISEAQLRTIYTKIREWRGDDNVKRKFAFWNISSTLSCELKSIFLPCLTSNLSDAIHELETAVSLLTTSQRSKKLKVGSIESLLHLPALISCLGHSFSADAREGGNWIRESDSQRYHTLMEPLTKLLLARVPADFPFAKTCDDGYYELIVKDGGVISCLVSLASAAGDETLWKPLNHAVLIACGNEDHVEIRRAGLICLLKLIQTLGEEYMVLLPECLPVLSELLEADEETAALARDCVDLSEDLLGESLEDSLR